MLEGYTLRVDGIRFPQKIVSSDKTADGKELVSTATFDRIVLNEQIPTGLFAAPNILPSKKVEAGAAGK